jgi:hypothetical protein
MPSSFATRGPALARTPSYRQQVQRRRLLVVCAMVGLALVSGLVGSLIHPSGHPLAVAAAAAAAAAADGPFSYFPAQ